MTSETQTPADAETPNRNRTVLIVTSVLAVLILEHLVYRPKPSATAT